MLNNVAAFRNECDNNVVALCCAKNRRCKSSRLTSPLGGEGNEDGKKKTTIGLIFKKATLHVQHTFFVHFFAVVLHDYNVKLPETP